MAIRSFNCPTIKNKDISNLDTEAVLHFFKENNVINGKIIREKMYNSTPPDSLPALKEWSREMVWYKVDWGQVLTNTFTGITNNYKLIQFQYKFLIHISPSLKLMRTAI